MRTQPSLFHIAFDVSAVYTGQKKMSRGIGEKSHSFEKKFEKKFLEARLKTLVGFSDVP
jgi:hypothetical protein